MNKLDNEIDTERAALAVNQVFLSASNLFISVTRRLQDIEATWTLYEKQGLLPATNVFGKLKKDIEDQLEILKNQDEYISERIKAFDLTPTATLEVDWQQVAKGLKKRHGQSLCNVKAQIFDSVLLYSEALTYLTQHLNSRIGTLVAAEATHGSNLTMHRFSGVETVYDAAECLMSDYHSNLTDDDSQLYGGLVVFGYNYQAAAWAAGLITFPLFAEHPRHMPMLVALAHEAAHWLQGLPPLAKFRLKVEQRIDYLIKTKYKGLSFIPLLGPVSVDSHTRFHPVESSLRRLAGEIICDIFATLVAGPAYPRVIARYFLPMYVDTVIPSARPSQDDVKSWAFYVSSFKLRIAAETALQIGATLGAKGFVDEKEASDIASYARLVEWALTDVATHYNENVPDNAVLRAALMESGALKEDVGSPTVLEAIRSNIEGLARDLIRGLPEEQGDLSKPILELFRECVGDRFFEQITTYPDPTEIQSFFCDNVLFSDVLNVWTQHPDWKPRHIISVLVPPFGSPTQVDVNHSAIMLALSHHPFIIKRYQEIRV